MQEPWKWKASDTYNTMREKKKTHTQNTHDFWRHIEIWRWWLCARLWSRCATPNVIRHVKRSVRNFYKQALSRRHVHIICVVVDPLHPSITYAHFFDILRICIYICISVFWCKSDAQWCAYSRSANLSGRRLGHKNARDLPSRALK